MASSKTVEREARAARERLRRYNARQSVHAHKVRRRLRDNIAWVTVAVIVITLATVSQVLYFSAGPGVTPPTPAPTETTPPAAEGANVGNVPDPALAEARTWTGEIALGDVTLGIELDGASAPQAVASFVQDTQAGYFAGKSCHRLTNDGFYVLQCGSVDGAGGADPSFQYGPIENAPADDVYPAGTVAMARAGGNAYSNGHQFFIVYETTTIASDEAGGYTVIGKVTSGLDQLVDQVASQGVAPGGRAPNDGAPVVPTTITRVSVN